MVATLALGCSRDVNRSHDRDITLGPRAAPQLGVAASAPGEAADGGMYTMAQVFDASARGAPSSSWWDTPSATVAPDKAPAPSAVDAAPAPPKVNPDDAVLERTRVASGGCFASLPAGPGFGPPTRSAHVSLVVVPTGTVTRAEVTSDDTDDPRVLNCIQRTGEAAVFSDNSGGPLRTYAIEVRVAAPGVNGSR
jgi:hypothetical protein